MKYITLSLVAALAVASSTFGQFLEVEPNENKALANAVAGIVSGGTISGTTTGSSTTVAGAASADTYRVQTGALPLGIYQHDLAITTVGAVGHTGTIRGLNQVAGVIGLLDNTFQTSSTTTLPARFNRWYGFGKQEEIFWRVAGTATTVGAYTGTLTTTPVTPMVIGPFLEGSITIRTTGQVPAATSDTDLWIYDSNLDAIAGYGNDDEFLGPNFQSRLTRTYAPGTYYMAISSFQFANNQSAPVDDDFRNGTVMDFANSAANSSSLPTTSTPAPISLNFSVTDACTTTPFLATKPGSYGVLWVCFTVLPFTPQPPWETNDAASELTMDNLQNTGTSGPISVVKCSGQYTRVRFNSTSVGLPWDLYLSTAPAIPAGPDCGYTGVRTVGGQAVNLDFIGNPTSIASLNGPLWFLTPFPGNYLMPLFSATAFPTVCAQMLNINPAHADGFSLSAPNCLRYDAPTSLAAPIAGPTGDDTSVTVSVGCVPFFFQAFTQLHVASNGRMTFGGVDNSFSPTVTSATSGVGWFGHWADLLPSIGPVTNVITIDSPAAGVFRAHYELVNFFGGGGGAITTNLILDANNGSLTIDGLLSLPAANTSPMMIGVCKGAAGGTDPGATTFALGGPNSPAGPSAAIYRLDTVANQLISLAGVNVIRFDVVTAGPNCGGYDWTGLP